MATWRKATARDMRVGQRVRITYPEAGWTFIGRIDRHWRGWNSRVRDDSRYVFPLSRSFSDWGTYTIEVAK